jgi:hypothetical protein
MQRGKDREQTPVERPIGHASDQSALLAAVVRQFVALFGEPA